MKIMVYPLRFWIAKEHVLFFFFSVCLDKMKWTLEQALFFFGKHEKAKYLRRLYLKVSPSLENKLMPESYGVPDCLQIASNSKGKQTLSVETCDLD